MASTIPTPITVPDPVARLARERRFGTVEDVRYEHTTSSMVAGGLATFIICSIVLAGMTAFNAAQDAAAAASHSDTTMHLVGPVGLFALVGLGAAIRGLCIGTRAHYLFSGGLIYQRRSGMTDLAWSQITALRAVYGAQRGQVVGYRPRTRATATAITVPLKLAGGRDQFIDRLLDHASEYDIPVE